ncbi:MAG: hypothetical protein KF801_02600 [Cryobacterium sp.]|nr:hypothetical protein [Cryobacterium sp.]
MREAARWMPQSTTSIPAYRAVHRNPASTGEAMHVALGPAAVDVDGVPLRHRATNLADPHDESSQNAVSFV